MNEQEILSAVKDLSKSQGLYGRLYEYLTGCDEGAEYLSELASKKFKSPVDLVLYIEC